MTKIFTIFGILTVKDLYLRLPWRPAGLFVGLAADWNPRRNIKIIPTSTHGNQQQEPSQYSFEANSSLFFLTLG